MDYQEIVYAKQDLVATITFNRPERLNALTQLMRAEILHATRDAREGPRAFIEKRQPDFQGR